MPLSGGSLSRSAAREQAVDGKQYDRTYDSHDNGSYVETGYPAAAEESEDEPAYKSPSDTDKYSDDDPRRGRRPA